MFIFQVLEKDPQKTEKPQKKMCMLKGSEENHSTTNSLIKQILLLLFMKEQKSCCKSADFALHLLAWIKRIYMLFTGIQSGRIRFHLFFYPLLII